MNNNVVTTETIPHGSGKPTAAGTPSTNGSSPFVGSTANVMTIVPKVTSSSTRSTYLSHQMGGSMTCSMLIPRPNGPYRCSRWKSKEPAISCQKREGSE